MAAPHARHVRRRRWDLTQTIAAPRAESGDHDGDHDVSTRISQAAVSDLPPWAPERTGLHWQQVPKGYYALPVYGYDLISADDPDTWQAPLLGHQTYVRRVARVCKNGRVIGQDAFIRGVGWVAHDADRDDFQVNNVWDDRDYTVDAILNPDFGNQGAEYRAIYGQITGRCGCCHKKLTEPKSKLLGIGPECRGFR